MSELRKDYLAHLEPINDAEKKFIIDTLSPYIKDRSLCGYDQEFERCDYLTSDGKSCAIGTHMLDDAKRNLHGSYDLLIKKHSFYSFMKPETPRLNDMIWKVIQCMHDNIAFGKGIENAIGELEYSTAVSFDELLSLK